jgi:hypothetical protein
MGVGRRCVISTYVLVVRVRSLGDEQLRDLLLAVLCCNKQQSIGVFVSLVHVERHPLDALIICSTESFDVSHTAQEEREKVSEL